MTVLVSCVGEKKLYERHQTTHNSIAQLARRQHSAFKLYQAQHSLLPRGVKPTPDMQLLEPKVFTAPVRGNAKHVSASEQARLDEAAALAATQAWLGDDYVLTLKPAATPYRALRALVGWRADQHRIQPVAHIGASRRSETLVEITKLARDVDAQRRLWRALEALQRQQPQQPDATRPRMPHDPPPLSTPSRRQSSLSTLPSPLQSTTTQIDTNLSPGKRKKYRRTHN
jgi:hypothetical protein